MVNDAGGQDIGLIREDFATQWRSLPPGPLPTPMRES